MSLNVQGWKPAMYRRGSMPSLASSLSLVSAVRAAADAFQNGEPQQLGDVLDELSLFADLAETEMAAYAAATFAKVEAEWIKPMQKPEDDRGVLG